MGRPEPPLDRRVTEDEYAAVLSWMDFCGLQEGFLQEAGAATLNYGNFISGIINFVIMAFVVFMLVKGINKMKKEEAPAPAAPTTKKCPFCKSEIALDATKCPHCTSNLE